MGIDPGTTSGYAVLDTEGNVLCVKSAKELGFSAILTDVMVYGTPIAVSTDKRNCPSMIARFAAKTGARIISPDEDMGVREKVELTSGKSCGNEHERDALASAMRAFKVLQPLLMRICRNLILRQKTGLKSEAEKLVVTKEISISSALGILTRRDTPEEIVASSASRAESSFRPDDEKEDPEISRLNAQLKRLERESLLLMRHNAKLLNALNRNKAKNRKLKAVLLKSGEAREKAALAAAERVMESLKRQLREKEIYTRRVQEQLVIANSMLAGMRDRVVLKKLGTLRWEEYVGMRSALKIREGDILLVRNPNEYDDRTVYEIREKVLVIVHREPVSPKLKEKLGFMFVDAKNLDVEESELFAAVGLSQLASEKARADLLASIVGSYRRERQQAL